MSDKTIGSEFDGAFTAGLNAQPKLITRTGDREIVVTPPGFQVHALERIQKRPDRHRGTHDFGDLPSFIEYLRRYAPPLDLMVTCSRDGAFKAVLNADTIGISEPGWFDWVASFEPTFTDAWKAWEKKDGTVMSQEDFAEHLEDWGDFCTEPDASRLHEIARTMTAKSGANYKTATHLPSGEVKFLYEETIEASAGVRGDISIPEKFQLSLPVFVGSTDLVRMVARFRYRLRSGSVTLHYKLHLKNQVKEVAVSALVAEANAAMEQIGLAHVLRTP